MNTSILEDFLNEATRKAIQKEEIEKALKRLEGYLSTEKKVHQDILYQLALRGKAEEVIKKVVEILSATGLKTLEGLITEGLKSIFYDRDYTIRIEVDSRGSTKTAEIFLKEGDHEAPIRDAIGGGVQTVVGLMLRVYFICVLKLRRVLFLDEALAAVSDKYIAKVYQFMGDLCEKGGFLFLVVSHDPRSFEFADKVYRVEKGEIYETEIL